MSSMEVATISRAAGQLVFGAQQPSKAITWGPGPSSAPADNKSSLSKKGAKPARPRGGKRPLRRIAIELDQLEVEVKAKLEELQKAESEHQRLANRLKVLETVIPVRERELNFLCQQASQALRGPVPLPALPAPPRIVELPPSLPGSPCDSLDVDALLFTHEDLSGDIFDVPPIVDSPTTESTEPQAVGGPAGSPSTSVPPPLVGQQQPTSSISSGSDASAEKIEPVLEPMSSGSSVFSTPTPREVADEQLARALAGFRDLWSNWLRDAGLLLHSHDARPQDPGPELKLLRMRQQLMPKMHALRQEYPCLSKAVFMYNLETGEREGAPVSHWAAVARSMALSPDQLAACLAALTIYRERAAPALAERERLANEVVAGLRAVCGGGSAAAAAVPAAVEATPEAVLRLCEGTEVLSRNIGAEGQAIDIVKDFLSNGVMSVVQLARIAVLSYPWFPDALALLTTLEELHLRQQQQQAAEAEAAADAAAATIMS